ALGERIKEDAALGGPPLIMLSSSVRPGDPARWQRLGLAGCLAKPVKRADLLAAVKVALGLTSPEEGRSARGPRAWGRSQRCLHLLLAEDTPVNQTLAIRLL